MTTLRVDCLDGFRVALAEKPLNVFQTDKMRALLVYLAIEGRVHPRGELAQFLWSGYSQASARNSLRQSLYQLRQLLLDSEADSGGAGRAPFLLLTRQTVQINPAASIQVDVLTFRQLLAECKVHNHADLAACPACLDRLRQAVDLYHSDFLADITVADSDPFEEWRRITQELLHIQALDALAQLANAAERAGDEEGALQAAQRQVALEPWVESAHRQIMRILAKRGQRAAAIAQYQRCRQMLVEELQVEPDAETSALYEQIQRGVFDKVVRRNAQAMTARPEGTGAALGEPGQAVDPAPLDDRIAMPVVDFATGFLAGREGEVVQLPEPLTPLIGRQQELNELLARLQEPGVRLLTLVGAGGMGKTRLALAVGRAIADSAPDALRTLAYPHAYPHTYPHGVFFIPLASLTTPDALLPTIASVLGITVGTDSKETLRQFLRNKQLLLILDNFEHILAGASAVADLLQQAPGVQILVTSRERMNVRGEQLYVVPPLHFAAKATLAEATDSSAVRLFVQSAQQAQANFQLAPANLAAVLRICQLVQGMPLGLELAAANVGLLPLHVIADEIERSANFLAADWQDAPERQRSMRAVFAWSWQLLGSTEQRALRQLAVFRGDFDRVAAQAVTGVTLPILARLIQKSLLQWRESVGRESAGGERSVGRESERSEGRYVIHELLRQFAAEALMESGEYALVEERFGRYFLAYLATRSLRLGRHEPKEASAEIGVELDNIRSAWQWAATQGQVAELELATYGWWQFCQLQGLEAEARQSFALAIAGVRQRLASTGQDAAAMLLAQRLLAKLLAIHANFLFAQGRDEDMAAQAREAIEVGAASGGVEGETFGSYVLGRALQEFEEYQAAGDQWRHTLDLVQRYQADHPESEVLHDAYWLSHNWLRGDALRFGDYARGRTHLLQGLQRAQMLGKRRAELQLLGGLSHNDHLLFDFASAEANYRTVLDLARTVGVPRVTMNALQGLGELAWVRGDYTRARTLLEEAVRMAAEFALPYDESLILASLIRLHCQIGDQVAATQRQEQLMQLMAGVKLAKECQLYAYLAAATHALYAGGAQQAHRYAELANHLNEQGGDILFRLVDTALILGHTRAAVGQWEPATAAFQQVLTAFQQFDKPMLAAEAQAGLAQIALAQGDLAAAQAQIEAILAAAPHSSARMGGYNDPFVIYLTCYQVLIASGDARATSLLQQGYDLMQKAAATLDEESRLRFLEAVPSHLTLVTAYREWQAQVDPALSDSLKR